MAMTVESPAEPNGARKRNDGVRRSRDERSKPNLGLSAKVARRELMRRRWSAALVVLLIALPTWITINGMTYIRTRDLAESRPAPDFSSDLVVPFTNPPSDAAKRSIDPSRFVGKHLGLGATRTTAEVETALPPDSTVQPVIGAYTSLMNEDGDIEPAFFAKIDLSTPAAASWAPLRDGRAAAPGEVVLGEELAARLGIGVGEEVTLREPSGTWVVAGISSGNGDLFAVRDFDESRLTVTSGVLLVNLPQGIDTATAYQLIDDLDVGMSLPAQSRFAGVSSSYDANGENIAISWLLAMLFFIVFGVVIIAAFATIARRQLVTVGQLAANGARPRFIGRMLAIQGFWAGLVGVSIGALATIATLPFVERLIVNTLARNIDGLERSPYDVAVIGLIGVAVATAAAALPSFGVAKTPVLDALAGRRRHRPVPNWMGPAGVITFGVGVFVMAQTWNSYTSAAALGAIIGALAIVIGVCLLGPLMVQMAAGVATMAPLSVRISLRGLGRARLRSAAVVASIAVTAGVMAVLVAGVQTQARGPQPGENAENATFVEAYPFAVVRSPIGEALLDDYGMPLTQPPNDIDSVELSWAPADASAAVDQVRSVLPDATEHPLRAAVRPDGFYDNSDGAFTGQPSSEDTATMSAAQLDEELRNVPLIADDVVLDGFSLPETFRRQLDAAGYAMAMTAQNCPGDHGYSSPNPVGDRLSDAIAFEPGTPTSIPVKGLGCWEQVGPFMTEKYATDHGYQIEPAGTVFLNPTALGDRQRDRLNRSFQLPSIFIDWDYAAVASIQTGPPSSREVGAQGLFGSAVEFYRPALSASDFRRVQLVVGVVAVVIVALITGIALALAASDSRHDRAVLSVIGAKPKTQRRVAASDALVLVVIGTALGVPAALFAARMVSATSYDYAPTGVPWSFVAAEFVVVPAVVAAAAYLTAWLRPPASPMRVLRAE